MVLLDISPHYVIPSRRLNADSCIVKVCLDYRRLLLLLDQHRYPFVKHSAIGLKYSIRVTPLCNASRHDTSAYSIPKETLLCTTSVVCNSYKNDHTKRHCTLSQIRCWLKTDTANLNCLFDSMNRKDSFSLRLNRLSRRAYRGKVTTA